MYVRSEELSACDPSVAMTMGAHCNLFSNNLNQNGSHEQKLKYLPAACEGTIVGGMCMSEPGTIKLVLFERSNQANDIPTFIFNMLT